MSGDNALNMYENTKTGWAWHATIFSCATSKGSKCYGGVRTCGGLIVVFPHCKAKPITINQDRDSLAKLHFCQQGLHFPSCVHLLPFMRTPDSEKPNQKRAANIDQVLGCIPGILDHDREWSGRIEVWLSQIHGMPYTLTSASILRAKKIRYSQTWLIRTYWFQGWFFSV